MSDGYFCPLMPPALLVKRLSSGKCRMEDGQLEKRCAKCATYWPLDTEFWYSAGSQDDGTYPWCKACYLAHRYPEGRTRTAQSVADAFTAYAEVGLALNRALFPTGVRT
jgi:hypothetical protein